MPHDRLVGIYLSTSAIHVGVYDLQGDRLASGNATVEEDTTIAWERALREAAPEIPESGICSVASTSGTAVLVDEYGEPVFEPQMYYESAPETAAHLQEELIDDESHTWDIALSSTSPLPEILTLREQYPQQFADVEWILSPTTWLLYRLRYGTGTRWREVETDWTNALKFGADITTPVPTWFDGLFEMIGLSESLMPEIRPPGSFIGTADSEFAHRTGIEGINLYQGMTDGNAFVLANGCFEPGDFSVTFGGASAVKYVTEEIKPHESLYYHRHPIEGYLPGAAMDTGEALRWLFEKVLDRPPERALELAKSITPGKEYDVYLPGNRGPFFDPDVSGSVLGLDYDRDLSTAEAHGRLARGLALGIVQAEGAYIELIEDHYDTTIENVRLMNDDAPSLHDDYQWWNTLRASVWGRPVIEMEPRTLPALLIPATLLSSTYEDPHEAANHLLRKSTEVSQDAELARTYSHKQQDYLERWRKTGNFCS